MQTILHVKPYNVLWLECIANNYFSMLTSMDEANENLLYVMHVNYLKKTLHQQIQGTELREKLLHEGYYFPKVKYSLDSVERLIEMQSVTFEECRTEAIYDFVKTHLSRGYFVFLSIDRYYYPTGRESGKLHMVHPVFIHGMDDAKQIFYAIEDCILPGTMQYYELPYRSVQASCQHFETSGQAVEATVCKPIAAFSDYYNHDDIVQAAAGMAQGLLGSEKIFDHSHELFYDTGLSSLENCAEEFVALWESMQEYSLYKMRVHQFQQVHVRNMGLMERLSTLRGVHAGKLSSLMVYYRTLHDHWKVFKEKSFKLLALRKLSNGTFRKELELLTRQLKTIRMTEANVAAELSEVCSMLGHSR